MRTRILALMASVTAAFALSACEIEKTVTADDQPISGNSVFELFTVNEDQDNVFNIVFVPDGSYGNMNVIANRQAFVDDMTDVIENGYWQNRAYFNGLLKYNYYYMTASGSVVERTPDANGNFRCPTVTWPAQADTDGAFADQLVLMHTNELRDCGGGGRATAEPTSFRTIVHETGHGLFGLPDEYCCDSFYSENRPIIYETQNGCTTDADNAAWRNCVSFVSNRDGETYWRSQGDITTNLIMRNGGNTVHETGPADWFVMEAAYDALGAPTVGTPSTFAPTPFDYNVPSN